MKCICQSISGTICLMPSATSWLFSNQIALTFYKFISFFICCQPLGILKCPYLTAILLKLLSFLFLLFFHFNLFFIFILLIYYELNWFVSWFIDPTCLPALVQSSSNLLCTLCRDVFKCTYCQLWQQIIYWNC